MIQRRSQSLLASPAVSLLCDIYWDLNWHYLKAFAVTTILLENFGQFCVWYCKNIFRKYTTRRWWCREQDFIDVPFERASKNIKLPKIGWRYLKFIIIFCSSWCQKQVNPGVLPMSSITTRRPLTETDFNPVKNHLRNVCFG